MLRPLGGEGAARARGDIRYHLIPRQPFLARLELENPEALSVIEGLILPELVLLLPMPAAPRLRDTPARLLLRDYWARRFEGEVARAWTAARDDNQDQEDQARFGPAALSATIGPAALAEAREVLVRDGVPGAAAGRAALCRAFVARVVRLRYFAPGTRGCHFPAVADWRAIDDWLEESGLDLPPPRPGGRLPLLLERSRPAGPCAAPRFEIQLPPDLPYGRDDPDRLAGPPPDPAPPAVRSLQCVPSAPGTALAARPPTEALCLAALHQAGTIRRRPSLAVAVGDGLTAALRPLLCALVRLRDRLPRRAPRHPTDPPRGALLRLRLSLLRSAFAAAQRAELKGRYAAALRHLRETEEHYAGLRPDAHAHTPVRRLLAQRAAAVAQSLAQALAIAGRLPAAEADALAAPLQRLAAEPGAGRSAALALLRYLERALLTDRSTYYRIEPRAWRATGRARQILPFQSILKELRALDMARRRLEDLPWPPTELDRLARPIGAISARLGERLEQQILPHLRRALEHAGFVAADATERIAVRRLADDLAWLVRTRWELRFGDLRDLLARDALRLPDATPHELASGDRLSRFDRAAALALPGVYRRGELYVKGLQRLSAPLFGTATGRRILRIALGPWLLAYLGLLGVALVWGLFADAAELPALTDATLVLPLALGLSLLLGTRRGRRLARGLWRLLAAVARFLLGPGLGRVLRRLRHRLRYFGPTAWLLERRLVRALIDRIAAPLLTGLVPLLPTLVPLWLATPEDLDGALWVAVPAVAFALGSWLRDTPAGRRWSDDLVTDWQGFWSRLRHEGLADLATAVMGFFATQTRRLAEGLYRVRGLLDRRLDEPWPGALIKTLAAPVWGAIESLIRFYAVVLIEPQTNPIKHFPVVTLGHKLLLPFLPAIALGMDTLLSPLLPSAVAIPLVALNVFLLPGLFGFLFWELKENWKLYAANRRVAVPQARLGAHGDTLRVLLRRGFHGGTLPKAFDRLRQTLERQAREGQADPRALRQATRKLAEIGAALARFAEQDLALPLREGCGGEASWLREIEIAAPRLATQAVELRARLLPAGDGPALELAITLATKETGVRFEAMLEGPVDALPEHCRARIVEAVGWFARRCGAEGAGFDPGRSPGISPEGTTKLRQSG